MSGASRLLTRNITIKPGVTSRATASTAFLMPRKRALMLRPPRVSCRCQESSASWAYYSCKVSFASPMKSSAGTFSYHAPLLPAPRRRAHAPLVGGQAPHTAMPLYARSPTCPRRDKHDSAISYHITIISVSKGEHGPMLIKPSSDNSLAPLTPLLTPRHRHDRARAGGGRAGVELPPHFQTARFSSS